MAAQLVREKSILLNLLIRALESNAEAHIKLLHHFEESGITEEQLHQFKRAWSKAVVKESSFRSQEFLDNLIFAEDVLQNIDCSNCSEGFGWETLKKAENFLTVVEVGCESSSSAPAALSPLLKLKLDLMMLSSKLKGSVEGTGKSTDSFDEDSIMAFRQWVRKSRCTWTRQHKVIQYSPLSQLLGVMNEVNGSLNRGDEVSSIVGVKVNVMQPTNHTRCWITYQSLSEATAMGHYNMLPLPIRVETGQSSTASMLIILEQPETYPLRTILGPSLMSAIHGNPIILSAWCKQLAILIDFLQSQSCSGRLMYQPKLDDVFIRHDGRLLLGQIAFEEKKSQNSTQVDIDDFASNILSSCLCLSRTHEIISDLTENSPHSCEDIVFIVEGSYLEISCGSLIIDDVFIRSESQMTENPSNLKSSVRHMDKKDDTCTVVVEVEVEHGIADVFPLSKSDSTISKLCKVHGLRSGKAMLHLLKIENGREECIGDLLIVILAKDPIENLSLVELELIVENSFTSASHQEVHCARIFKDAEFHDKQWADLATIFAGIKIS